MSESLYERLKAIDTDADGNHAGWADAEWENIHYEALPAILRLIEAVQASSGDYLWPVKVSMALESLCGGPMTPEIPDLAAIRKRVADETYGRLDRLFYPDVVALLNYTEALVALLREMSEGNSVNVERINGLLPGRPEGRVRM